MKQSKVVALIKRDKQLIVQERRGEQWIGQGGCYWRMGGMPHLSTAGEFFALYDVPEEARDKYYTCFRPVGDALDLRDAAPDEQEAQPLTVTVTWHETEYCAFRWTGGLLYCKAEYLGPVGGIMGRSVYCTVRRSEAFGPYLCVKEGLLLTGIVFPTDMGDEPKADFADELMEFASGADEAQGLAQAAKSGGEYGNQVLLEMAEESEAP